MRFLLNNNRCYFKTLGFLVFGVVLIVSVPAVARNSKLSYFQALLLGPSVQSERALDRLQRDWDKDYFATDRLMFSVPERDTRLKNKDEILGLVFDHAPDVAVAYAVDYLAENPLFKPPSRICPL